MNFAENRAELIRRIARLGRTAAAGCDRDDFHEMRHFEPDFKLSLFDNVNFDPLSNLFKYTSIGL